MMEEMQKIMLPHRGCGQNVAEVSASGDGIYDYAAGAIIGEIGSRLRLFNNHVGALGPADPSNPDAFAIRMMDAGMLNPQYGYRVLYDLRKVTDGWRCIAGPQERP